MYNRGGPGRRGGTEQLIFGAPRTTLKAAPVRPGPPRAGGPVYPPAGSTGAPGPYPPDLLAAHAFQEPLGELYVLIGGVQHRHVAGIFQYDGPYFA